jgi:multicomponent K+:H+ antiporter subunit A
MNPLTLIVMLPLVLGCVGCACLGASNTPLRRKATALWAGAITATALAMLLAHSSAVLAGQVLLFQAQWMPAIGLNLNWRLDGLALLFATLILGMGLLIVLYAAYYLDSSDPAGKFFGQLMLFMAAMLGIVLADNLLLLVVFWELTSMSSFLLVGYWGQKAKGGAQARAGARMALAVTGGGGLALLGGVIVLGQIAGTHDISTLLTTPGLISRVQADARYPIALTLVLIGCFSKSAQWPLHFWLPQAMAAPTPVSAYLHSATMVKAGLFLLLRLFPVIGGTESFQTVVASVGLFTMVFAAFVAIFKHDLKALLAYSTVSHLGLVTFLIGLSTPMATVAALFHIINHACFKAALFMSAGIVDHAAHTRDMRKLGGLMTVMPVMGTLVMLASAAMAGLPPFNGFISKEMMLTAAVSDAAALWPAAPWLVPALATLGGLFAAAYSLRLAHDVFFNGPARSEAATHAHEPAWGMKAPVVLLVLLCALLGFAPMPLVGAWVQAASSASLAAPPPAFDLALWHGMKLPLLLSGVALVGGLTLYSRLMHRRRLHAYLPREFQAASAFENGLAALVRHSCRFTQLTENGSLQRYAASLVVGAVVLAAWALMSSNASVSTGDRPQIPATPLALVLWVLLIATCAALLLTHHLRFRAVVLVGVIGLVTSITFLGLSAPDLALTQLAVEVVSTVLLLMGLALLPARTPRESSSRRRLRDALLAGGAGIGMAWLAWLVMTSNHDSISWYFLANTISKGGGANAVNVILVDFRGYDTWGEITVLGIAAVGVLALLDGFKAPKRLADSAGRSWTFPAQPLMLQVIARLILPLAVVVSIYLYWRGHNLPGGGFVAGLITASALVLQYMAFGHARAEQLIKSHGGQRLVLWIAAGLAVAAATGLGAWVFEASYFTSHSRVVSLPVLGDIGLASAAIFDLGVYITVVGSTVLTLSALGSAGREQRAGAPV